MTCTSTELKIVPCNYIMLAKLAKISLNESNLYGINFYRIQVIKQAKQITILVSG